MNSTNLFLSACCVLALFACGPTTTTMDSGMPTCSTMGEPNDTRETATTIAFNQSLTGCVGGAADTVDFFEFTAPDAGAAGGVITVAVTNVTPVAGPDLTLFAAIDNGSIVNTYETDPGKSASAWLTVKSGAKYRIKLQPFALAVNMGYSLGLTFKPIDDAFEPNDRREDAKPLTLGTAIQASVGAASAASMLTQADVQDWFKVTLAAGAATIRMSNVPSDFSCDVTVYDAAGTEIANKYSTTDGANCQVDVPSTNAAGEVTIKINRFAGLVSNGGPGTPPASYASQYSLVATQP